jgi:hypothetical protein
VDKAESIRIHLDWWGQCRTCEFWNGDRGTGGIPWGECSNPKSMNKRTTSDGDCKGWDSFDYEGACGALDEDKRMHPELYEEQR